MTDENSEANSDFAGVDIWERIDPSLAAVIVPETDEASEQGETKPQLGSPLNKPTKRMMMAWTAVAIIIWVYVFLKVFVFDLDRWLASSLLGNDAIVNYRPFIILALVALTVLLVRRSWMPLAYVFFFPVIVTCVYLPMLIYKKGTMQLLFAAVHIISSAGYRFRWRFAAGATTILLASAIFLSQNRAVLGFAGVWMMAFLLVLYFRGFRSALSPSRFVRQQLESIQWLVRSELTWKMVGLEDELKAPGIVKYNATQIQSITTKIGFGLTLHRAVYVWAKNLQRYGKSGTSAMISTLYFVALFITSFVLLGLTNMALYGINPSQFDVAVAPSLVKWWFYSLSALALSGTEGIAPAGDLAVAIRIYAGILGPVLLLTLLANIRLDRRNARQDEDLDSAVDDLRQQGGLVSDRFRKDFGVSPREAAARLEQLGLTIGLSLFGSALPENYDELE